MALTTAVVTRNDRLAQYTSAIGASGLLRIYSGTRPTNPDTALAGNTLLAELALSATFAPAPSGGVLTANAISNDTSADATGTAEWGTLTTSGGVRVIDFSVGTAGADLNLNTVSIVTASVISVSSLTITAAA
jgi:hypothetical protein